MKRRPYYYESQAFFDRSFRRAQLARASNTPVREVPAQLQLFESAAPAAPKMIEFPRVDLPKAG